jgi:hypothetical protein
MSVSDKDTSDQKVKEQANEMRAKYPIFTAVLEKIPEMDPFIWNIGYKSRNLRHYYGLFLLIAIHSRNPYCY